MKKLFRTIIGAVFACTMVLSSCERMDCLEILDKPSSDNSADGGNGSLAGTLTAGEWNDLEHWDFWKSLIAGKDFSGMTERWGFHTDSRIAVLVTDTAGNPLPGLKVEAMVDGENEWTSITDNHGKTNCWISMFGGEDPSGKDIKIRISGKEQAASPVISWGQDEGEAVVNHYKVSPRASTEQSIDIAFIVDATGSMQDEIDFLKDDLEDIINRASSLNSEVCIRTGAVFYRDTDDEYLTRSSDFTDDLSATRRFIREQNADGGGDYPEAVHTALETALSDLSWNGNARSRIAFLILDAPAHEKVTVTESIQKSIEAFAKNGIIILPVAASGADKVTEFMLRFFAIATNGTYSFLTDDSGVGGEHVKPSVGDYQVEALNDLMTRLIGYYME